MKLLMMLLWSRHLCSHCPFFERSGGNVPAYRYQQSLSHCITFQDVCVQQPHAENALTIATWN